MLLCKEMVVFEGEISNSGCVKIVVELEGFGSSDPEMQGPDPERSSRGTWQIRMWRLAGWGESNGDQGG